jgi:transglutaminase-like putative cysteine protease
LNSRPNLERHVTHWLRAAGTADGSDRVLAATLVRVAQVRQERTHRIPSLSDLRQYVRPVIAATAMAVALTVVAATAIPPLPRAASATVSGVWPTGPDVAFTAELPPGAPNGMYWRAAMLDAWSGSARDWRASAEIQTTVEAGASILDVAEESLPASGLVEIPVTIAPGKETSWAVAPGMPTTLDQATEVESTGPGGSLVRVGLSRPGTSYRVTGVRLALGSKETPEGVSSAKLAAAGTDYPPDILARFAVPPEEGELGVESMAFLKGIREAAGDSPYQIANLMEQRFRNSRFTYAVDTRDVDCAGDGFTECFMRVKRGYCMYFATAMIMLLRHEGIPARFVMGYLPGNRVGTVETVRTHEAHAWVEVFFPGWGWWPFDPTPRVP